MNQTRKNSSRQRGQIVVEYVLLLVIAVSVAALVTSQLAKRDPDNPGALVQKWDAILKVIGSDLPDNGS